MENYALVTGGKLLTGDDIPELLAELLSEQIIGVGCRALEDCDDNQVLDECDVASGTSFDCNENGRLDECELASGSSFDCDSDGFLNKCEIDCDTNGVADDCEAGPVLFVDANVQGGAGNGFTWDDAFPLLQDALAAASNCRFTQVWVAAGTYFPDEGATQTLGDRDATFNLISRVSIYGGFAGGESLLSERDIGVNPTILSGDISAGDLDSIHVVTAAPGIDGTAILDGFTITGGRADAGAGDSGSGAGFFVSNDASPSIFQCMFDGNYALVAGGGALVKGEAGFVDCTFSNNESGNDGGAVGVDGSAAFESCTFEGNVCGNSGGAVHAMEADTVFSNCDFQANNAANEGGAVYVGGGSVQVADSFFGANGADFGAGISAAIGATGTVGRSTFVANTAQESGGAMLIQGFGSNLNVGNSFFGTNGALGEFEGGGGVAVFFSSDATLFNCVFSDNRADFGGGVDVFQASATIVNSTFSRNQAVFEQGPGGGGLENSESDGTSVVNCVFRENADLFGFNQIALVQDSGTPTNLRISHSNIEGGEEAIDTCPACVLTYLASNIDADPLFVDPDGDDDRDGTADDNVRLLPGSPSIDAGSNGAVAAILTDFDGNARIFNTVDMGAFEDFLDCNSNSIADPADLMDFNQDGAIDLLDFQAFQLCFGLTASGCLAAFDRALDCGVIDLADFEVLFDQYTGPTGGIMMLMDGGGGQEEFGMAASSDGSSESAFEAPELPPDNPWTVQESNLDFEIHALGGGDPLTVLQPHTAYELQYDAKAQGVTSSLLGSLAATAAEGLAIVEPPSDGVWSDTGSFMFEAFSDADPIPDPAGTGLYRTTWTRDEVVLPGETDPSAPSYGFLHIITTGDEGTLTLELYLDYVDESGSAWVGMEARKAYQVEE